MAIYEGGDIDSITTENVVAVVPLPTYTLITFKVHGSEGFRTYKFDRHISDILETVGELAEFL
jgi:hypothetical protein